MKPHIARLCLKHLDEYAIQFEELNMVAKDGTIQTFNGMLCDRAPVSVCQWFRDDGCWVANGWYELMPNKVEEWAGLPFGWSPYVQGIHTLPQLRAWLEQQAKGVK